MPFDNITLGMDLSLSSPGFAVLATTDVNGRHEPILLEASHVKTNAKKSHGYRLSQINEEIGRLLVDYRPNYVVREKGFSRFPKTTQSLFKVVGVSDLSVYSLSTVRSIEEIAPTSVKKDVSGNGRASKEDVQFAVKSILQIENADFFATNDESDAAGVCLAYMYKEGLIRK